MKKVIAWVVAKPSHWGPLLGLFVILAIIGATRKLDPTGSAGPAAPAVPATSVQVVTSTATVAPGTEPAAPASAVRSAAPAPKSGAGEMVVVPDVSGMNHQEAQNRMQAAGLYNLREVDGSGEGRLLIMDRNWVQTGQSPKAGTKVTPDTVITLTAVKQGER